MYGIYIKNTTLNIPVLLLQILEVLALGLQIFL
jgi:hypothetical protein